jgi:hypothetical protein
MEAAASSQTLIDSDRGLAEAGVHANDDKWQVSQDDFNIPGSWSTV